MGWHSDVITRLVEHKRYGTSFEAAWAQTIMELPPRGREFGVAVRSLQELQEDEEWGEPFDVFLKRVAKQAWMGEKGVLRHMTADLSGGFSSDDGSGYAVKNGRMTNRAAA